MKQKIEIFTILFIGIAIGIIFYPKKLNDNYVKENSEEKESGIQTPEPIINKHSVELTITGDFLYEEPYYEALRNGEDENLYFSKVKKYFQYDDLSIGNMEVVISDGTMELSGVGYSFCAPESVGYQVIDLGMEVMSTANNHSNDRGLEGRISTRELFQNNSDILTVGTYDENRDIIKNITEINGIKIGFLAYTYKTNVKIPENLRYSIGLYRDPDTQTITDEYKEIIKQEVETLREQVDCLIVMMHWGNEFTFNINEEQEFLSNYLNSLGVDIIIGNHSHCIQPIKWIHGEHDTLVYYSLGNFVSADHIVDRTGETFTNAYQLGLLSKLKINLEDNNLTISDITTEPIINYYDANLRNFTLIPFSEYRTEYETSHYLYNNNFNRNFIQTTYDTVIDKEFRNRIN